MGDEEITTGQLSTKESDKPLSFTVLCRCLCVCLYELLDGEFVGPACVQRNVAGRLSRFSLCILRLSFRKAKAYDGFSGAMSLKRTLGG